MSDLVPVQSAGEQVLPPSRPMVLSDAASDRVLRSVPEGTARAYRTAWRLFTAWCATEGRTPLPCDAGTLAEWVSHLADLNRAPSTIDKSLSSISKAHRLAEQPAPATDLARAVLMTHRRDRSDRGATSQRARALITSDVRRMCWALSERGEVRDVRDRALIVWGFGMGARRSELVALNVGDAQSCPEGVEVTVRRSKSDQGAHGRIVALPRGRDLRTCPVATLQSWLDVAGIVEGPLFRRIDRHGRIGRDPGQRGSNDGRLAASALPSILRRAAELANLSDCGISAHSLRRGMATEAHRGGADLLSLSRHGGWADGSTVMMRYIDDVDRWQNNPAGLLGL